MREIKFRAWDKKYDDFINDGYIIFNGMIYRDDRDFEDGQNTNDIELMQYTGLKDKNGVEIYKGDILKYEDGINRELIFANGCFGVRGAISEVVHQGRFELLRVEVIGNIYENPELLEVK